MQIIRFKMADEHEVNVDAVLSEAKSRFKTIDVSKEVEPELDMGNLLLNDLQPVNMELFRKNKEDFLLNLARDNTQLLFNEIWKLQVERYEDVLLAKLPEPTTIIPREKPIPKPKPLTKWEKFAKEKGFKKTKRERKIWDEAKGKWLPRYGYKRTNDETKDWIIEVPKNADPYEDQFEKRIQKKKENVNKNEYQRLRNIARHKNVKVPDKNLQPSAKPTKDQLQANINAARKANASIGKFTQKLEKEKVPKNPEGRKRKFDKVAGEFLSEKTKSMEVVDKMFKKGPTLDVNKFSKAGRVFIRGKALSEDMRRNFIQNIVEQGGGSAVGQHIAKTQKSAADRNKQGGGRKKGKNRSNKRSSSSKPGRQSGPKGGKKGRKK